MDGVGGRLPTTSAEVGIGGKEESLHSNASKVKEGWQLKFLLRSVRRDESLCWKRKHRGNLVHKCRGARGLEFLGSVVLLKWLAWTEAGTLWHFIAVFVGSRTWKGLYHRGCRADFH